MADASKISGPVYQSGSYGSAKAFKVPGLGNERYWIKVGRTPPNIGKVEVWNEETGIILDSRIGVFDSATDKWTFNEGTGGVGLRKVNGKFVDERKIFTDPEVKKFLLGISNQTVVEGELGDGERSEETVAAAEKEANAILKQNKAVVQDKLSDELEKKGGKDKFGTRRDFSNPQGGAWVYPETIRQSEQDLIKFTILKYKPKGFKARENSLDFFGERSIFKGREPVGTIILPIPANIGDSNSCDWGENSMTALQAAVANIGLEFLTGTDLAKQVGATAKGMQSNKEQIKDVLGNAVVEAATGGAGGALLSRTKGVIMNPNMELLFKKPQLRPFNFTFKLAPRSRKEAISVINIIRTFKQSMAPIRSQSNLFLRTPHTYRLQYMSRGKVHPYLNMFKECALTNLNMKYTPDGNYSTYEDGVMTAYEMTMQFKELEPVFNDDYEMSASSTIGQDTDLDWDSDKPGSEKMSTKIGY